VPTPLLDYYRELQLREGLEPTDLVAEWDNAAVDKISADFRAAMGRSQITQQVVPIRPGSSNQSVGNQVADFFTLQFPASLAEHVIHACPGAGYPDKILVRRRDEKTYPLELKATSGWNAADSNRRVLTSSSRKLRQQFHVPINHLLATIIYVQRGNDWFIASLRLDFVGPNTLVNIRLEASVSHRLLAQATHPSITIQ
jgi:hypothetical protein